MIKDRFRITIRFSRIARAIALIVLASLGCLHQALADNYYVNATTGSNTTGTGTQPNPWKTITYALSQISGSGHTMTVAGGTYSTSVGEPEFPNRKSAFSSTRKPQQRINFCANEFWMSLRLRE